MLGRAQWGPVGRFEALHNLDYWKWMEQGFGLVMGFGVGLGFLRILRGNLAPAKEDVAEGPMDWLALIFLFVIEFTHQLTINLIQRGVGSLVLVAPTDVHVCLGLCFGTRLGFLLLLSEGYAEDH